MDETVKFWLTIAGFTLTYVGLALGKIPGLRLDRAGIAVVGSAFLLATGTLTFAEAIESVDHQTLVLLFAMMIVVAYLRLAGFFQTLAGWALARFRRPAALLGVTILLSGVLSAFLVNDVVCVALTPLVLHLTRRLKLDPVPHLIGLATAANIGSTATITGNPQNMIIGNYSNIPYMQFAARLAPIALIGLVLDYVIIFLVYRRVLVAPQAPSVAGASPGGGDRGPLHRAQRRLLYKSLAVTIAIIALFFVGLPIELVALGGAALLLLERLRPERIYRQIDWSLLVMFAGLFVVVHAFEVNVVRTWGMDGWGPLRDHPVCLLSIVSAGLSNLVSNVPAVLLFRPVIPALPENVQQTAWLALAMSSTLAGNLTVLGSVANLIVVESARREGTTIGFWEYCRAGIPITLLTLLAGIGWLSVF